MKEVSLLSEGQCTFVLHFQSVKWRHRTGMDCLEAELVGQELGEVDRLSYLNGCISPVGRLSDEASSPHRNLWCQQYSI